MKAEARIYFLYCSAFILKKIFFQFSLTGLSNHTLLRTTQRWNEDANRTPRSDALPRHAPPTPPGPRHRGILGHAVFSSTKAPPLLLPLALETSGRCVPPDPFLLPLSISRSSVPGFGGPFTTLGLRVGLGPLFGKATWTSTAMAEGEEVLPLPTSSGDRW